MAFAARMGRPGDWYQKQRRATSLVCDGGDGDGDGGEHGGGGDGSGDGSGDGGGYGGGGGDGGSAAAGAGPGPEPRCLAGCSGGDCRCAELVAAAFSALPTWAA